MNKYVIEFAGKCRPAGVVLVSEKSRETAYQKFCGKYRAELKQGTVIFVKMAQITEEIYN